MVITKIVLPRRTFLRGVGATLALPFLDAMGPAFAREVKTAAAPVCRLGFIYHPNGFTREYWTPDAVGTTFELKSSLKSLERHRDRLTIVSGLANLEAEAKGSSPGPHSRGSAA